MPKKWYRLMDEVNKTRKNNRDDERETEEILAALTAQGIVEDKERKLKFKELKFQATLERFKKE
jgi:hypothetical protein